MADVVVLLLMIGFIAVCVAYVRWCDRIIGPDPVPAPNGAETEPAGAGR